jgi:hypothetical protein
MVGLNPSLCHVIKPLAFSKTQSLGLQNGLAMGIPKSSEVPMNQCGGHVCHPCTWEAKEEPLARDQPRLCSKTLRQTNKASMECSHMHQTLLLVTWCV